MFDGNHHFTFGRKHEVGARVKLNPNSYIRATQNEKRENLLSNFVVSIAL